MMEDRISQLLDDVLLNCLSLLELKTAAQTSILSKRWRYLWTHLTKLNFISSNRKLEARKYFDCVSQVVRAHRGPAIHKFRVTTRCNLSNCAEVDEWVKFALSKRTKELVLDFVDTLSIPFDDDSRNGNTFGFDVLKHYGITTSLESLHLSSVNVTGEFLEFLLSHCHRLERLLLDWIPLSSFRVKTSKLKYLKIATGIFDLEEVEFDAKNLLQFEYEDARSEGGPRMVFKNVPMLVGTKYKGGFCRYPFPVFEKLSSISNLTKLSLEIEIDASELVIPDGVIPCFPNLKQFSLTIMCEPRSCILSLKRFLEACPILEEFKLTVFLFFSMRGVYSSQEASELQNVDLEDEKDNVKTEIEVKLENGLEKKHSHHKLRVLELVGFLGVSVDTRLALSVVSYALSLETIVCNTKGVEYNPINYPFKYEYDDAER